MRSNMRECMDQLKPDVHLMGSLVKEVSADHFHAISDVARDKDRYTLLTSGRFMS